MAIMVNQRGVVLFPTPVYTMLEVNAEPFIVPRTQSATPPVRRGFQPQTKLGEDPLMPMQCAIGMPDS